MRTRSEKRLAVVLLLNLVLIAALVNARWPLILNIGVLVAAIGRLVSGATLKCTGFQR